MALIFVKKTLLHELQASLTLSSAPDSFTLNPLLTRKGLRQLRAIDSIKKSEQSDYSIVSLKKWKHSITKLRRNIKKLRRDKDQSPATVLASSLASGLTTTATSAFEPYSKTTSEHSEHSEHSEPCHLTKTLSVGLINTYREVNRNHYTKKADSYDACPTQTCPDDNNGNLILSPDLLLRRDYRVLSTTPIGKGTFGQVVMCEHIPSGKSVAIKIINSQSNFTRQAKTEMDILARLVKKDVPHVVHLIDVFEYKGHVCFVFPVLGPSLYDVLKQTKFTGLSLNLVRKIARQLFFALNSMLPCPKTCEMGIIHSDLKPENILLVHPRNSAINIIDFGSACATDGRAHSYIQSRYYRAPEVILRGNYTHPIDMWSMGCILVELHTGEPLFPGVDEFDMICGHITTLGMPPHEVITGRSVSKYFDTTEDGNFVLRSTKNTPGSRPLADILGVTTGGPKGSRQNEATGHTPEDYAQFLDLVRKLLEWSPASRIHPADAFEHPFLKVSNKNI